METKRLIIAITLAVLIFVSWNLIFPPQTTQNQEPQTPQTGDTAVPELLPDNSEPSAVPSVATRKITVDHPFYIAEFDEKGAMITSFKLKNYRETADPSSPYKELLADEFQLAQVGLHPVGAPANSWNNEIYSAHIDEDEITITDKPFTITFTMTDQNNIKVDKCFSFNPESYVITFDTFITNLAEVPWNNALAFELEGVNQNAVKNQ